MSSLAAARADNFYYPKDFDPDKHGSLNKYHGTHALRERAARISEGILVIRFEVPFHIWCSKCGEKIAKGRRFNADKKAIGQYHSTKILQFSMRHHCGCIITIQTDPKNAEYVVVEGAKKKVEDYTAEDAGVIELLDDTEKERLALDPLYRLEKGEGSKKRARSAAEDVAALLEDADAKHANAYATNAKLRAQLRVVRKQEASLDAERKALHLPEEIQLLPHAQEDAHAAALALYAHDAAGGSAAQQQVARRQAILAEPIFEPAVPSRRLPPSATLKEPHKAGAGRPMSSSGLPLLEQSVSSAERLAGNAGEHHPPSKRRTGELTANSTGGAGRHLLRAHQDKQQQPTNPPAAGHHGSHAAGGDADGNHHLTPAPWQAAVQPGSASGANAAAASPGTAAAAAKRGTGLHAAHHSARASVAAWQAGRNVARSGQVKTSTPQPTASKTAAAKLQRHGGSHHHQGSSFIARQGQRGPAAAATLAKAKHLAQQQRMGGVGFAVPHQQRY